jgi:3-oxoacyl-[acyl-carrier protein] reductase
MNTPLPGPPQGRVAIVTGGSHGVGRAIVRSLAVRAHAVVVNYLHDQRAAESTVEMVLADNGAAVAVRADVTDELDVERLFAETDWIFGGVDVVVHAAGSRVMASPVLEAGLDEFDALVRINTRATLIVNREAARHLRNGGAIVNLATSADDAALRNYGLYSATKAAVDVLTRGLASDLRERDITVNAVSLEVDRPCAPSNVAEAVALLINDHGQGLTGQVLRIDDPKLQPAVLPSRPRWRIR